MVRFRIDNCTIKRGKLVSHYGYLVPLVSTYVAMHLVVSGSKEEFLFTPV